jgi:hypothetical protein
MVANKLTRLLSILSLVGVCQMGFAVDLPQLSADDLQAMLDDPKVKALFDQQQQHVERVEIGEALAAQQKQNYQERRDFYRDYIAKYYPKAMVICEDHLARMTPEQIAQTLARVITIFTEQPWFYFVNNPKGFKLIHYWEFVVDQLSIFHTFIGKVRIRKKDNSLWILQGDDELIAYWASGGSAFRESTALVDYLADLPNSPLYDFYALSFDYLIKLFNEGILLSIPSQALSYFAELEFIMDKLHGSSYEAEYQEHLTTAQELLMLLKHQLGLDEQKNLGAPGRFGGS